MTSNQESSTLYFTFVLGTETYAINVKSIREVLTKERITPVPRTEKYMKGIMNVRGMVIPVIDFRDLFQINKELQNDNFSIIVTEYTAPNQPTLIFGFVADRVEGVTTLDTDSISIQTHSELSAMNSKYIKRVGKLSNQFILILDLDQILDFIAIDLEEKSKTI